jgi:hypothetical protein
MTEFDAEASHNVPQRESPFFLVGARDNDSQGSTKWKDFLDRDKLLGAWKPPDGSPYQRFVKTKTIESVNQWTEFLKPRYSQGEITSEEGIQNLISTGNVGNDTAIILDSGAAHSVAMAIKLVENGYQPVVMFDTALHPQGSNKAHQGLATLLYFAEQIEQLKQQGVIKPDTPPVFILDTHRGDTPLRDKSVVDNSYSYVAADFPNSEELKQQGITKIVYLNEGDQEGKINAAYQGSSRLPYDLKPIAEEWVNNGITMQYTGVAPWKTLENASSGFDRNFVSAFRHAERRLSYPDMPPTIYGDNRGIAMQRDHERFILTNTGKLEVLNEMGFGRAMRPDEVEQFKAEIAKQLTENPDNEALRNLAARFPQETDK